MTGSWIKIHRRLKDSDLWTAESFTRGQAWVDLLMLANWTDGYVYIRDVRVDLNRGQLVAGSRFLAERWQWSRGKVFRFLNTLKRDHRIDQQKTAISTVVTILNYDEYQGDSTTEQATDQTTDSTTDSTTDRTHTKKNKEETKKKQRKDTSGKLPSELDTVEFGNAWSEWEQHRREIKKTLTPLAAKRQINLLLKMGHDRAIAAIQHSVMQGYAGIYEAGSRGSKDFKTGTEEWKQKRREAESNESR